MEVRERMPNTHLIRGLKDLERIGKEAIHEYIMIDQIIQVNVTSFAEQSSTIFMGVKNI